MLKFKAIGVSEGLAHAKALVIERGGFNGRKKQYYGCCR